MTIVWKHVTVPWSAHDWRGTDDGERAARLDRYLADDRRQGIDVADAPPMRVAAIRLDDATTAVVWTCHHLFVDGWSSALVLDEVVRVYTAAAAGEPPPPPGPTDTYRRYFAWATTTDSEASREYWSSRLAGVAPQPRLSSADPDPAGGFGAVSRRLEPAAQAAVTRSAAALRSPPNALVQAAWALVLSRLLDCDDVVFGVTVAGRAAPVEGIETLVGFLSNIVPVRATGCGELSVGELVTSRRDEQFELQAHEHVFLSDIQTWSGLPGGRPLFETLLVVENFPWNEKPRRDGSLAMDGFQSEVTTTLPLTIAVAMADTWTLQCTYDRARLDGSDAAAVLDAFAVALAEVAGDATRSGGEVRDSLPAPAGLTAGPGDPIRSEGGHLAPRTAVEQRLAGIWEQTLGVGAVGVRDDFFALGGTSIVAVRLFGEIERQLGVRLPLATLLETPTIEGLAARLGGETVAEWECLVPIQLGDSRPPLTCLHAAGLHVLFYRPLAHALGPDQTVYGLEPVGRTGERPPLRTIEEIAAAYVSELRAARPAGPYRLVGHCQAGVVCVEMAHQLEAAGEVVDLIALIDPFVPHQNPPPKVSIRARRIVSRSGVRALPGRIVAKLGRRVRRQWLRLTGRGSQLAVEDEIRLAYREAFRDYDLRPCRSPITLIWSSDGAEKEAWRRRWSGLSSQVDEQFVDARHPVMLEEPHVAQIAELLRPRLAGS